MTMYKPVEAWQSTDGDTWKRRYMAAKGGAGYVREATVTAKGRVYVHIYRRAIKPKRVLVCSFLGDRDRADIVSVQPLRLARGW